MLKIAEIQHFIWVLQGINDDILTFQKDPMNQLSINT